MSETPPNLRRWQRPTRRRADWDSRLCAWIETASARPHRFGRHDCVLFIAGAVEAQTGRDLARGHRRRWRSHAGGRRYVRALGFRTIGQLLDALLPPIAPAFAQRGDVVLWRGVPGICIGGEALFVRHRSAEPARAPRSEWSRAWAVGRKAAEVR